MGPDELKAALAEAPAAWVPFSTLTPWGRNPRKIPESAIVKVAMSMCTFGFGAPLIARKQDHRLVAGHTRSRAFAYLSERYRSAEAPEWMHPVRDVPVLAPEDDDGSHAERVKLRAMLESQTVPVRLMNLSSELADKLALADNRLGEEAEWDYEMLAGLLHEMPEDERFLTGFDDHELEPLLAAEWQPPPPEELPGTGGNGDGGAGGGSGGEGGIQLSDTQAGTVVKALELARTAWKEPGLTVPVLLERLCDMFVAAETSEAVPSVPPSPVVQDYAAGLDGPDPF